MIRLRVDVDYHYPSRLKSVSYLLTGGPVSEGFVGSGFVCFLMNNY